MIKYLSETDFEKILRFAEAHPNNQIALTRVTLTTEQLALLNRTVVMTKFYVDIISSTKTKRAIEYHQVIQPVQQDTRHDT